MFIQVCFKARFDVRGFEADDVRVDMDGNQLTVHAKKEFEDASRKSVREFCRVLDLPESIDKEKLQCSLTSVSYFERFELSFHVHGMDK